MPLSPRGERERPMHSTSRNRCLPQISISTPYLCGVLEGAGMSDDTCIMAFLDAVYVCPVPETIEEVEIDDEPDFSSFSEKFFENQICDIMDRDGHIYERQKPCANGIIDIIVWGQTPDIIEVKRSGSPRNLIKAIVQLKFYAACYKRSRLLIAVPGGIAEEHLHILKEFGVQELRITKHDEGYVWRLDI